MVDEGSQRSPSGSPPRRKVGRLIEAYGLEGMADRLERAWLSDGEDRRSLRDLATDFNERLVHAAMADAGLSPLDGEAANTYRLLTADDVTTGTRKRAERRLERAGVDVDALRADFVSHQAIYTFLTEVRDVEHSRGETGDPVESGVETVQRLGSRARSVAEGTVDSLDRAGRIDVGEVDVAVDLRVTCRDCHSQYDVADLLERGGCDCPD